MTQVLQATSRGQVTLPKKWRDQFNTDYFYIEIQGDTIKLTPLIQNQSFEETVESAWNEYQNGKVIQGSALMKKYGL